MMDKEEENTAIPSGSLYPRKFSLKKKQKRVKTEFGIEPSRDKV